jgi:DNA-binding LacI/PurR family transcriptional regulator
VGGNGFLDGDGAKRDGATVKLSEVALHASVSPATVSRVLNGDPRVGAKYRERVLRSVAELEYRPNQLARSLRRQRSGTIGVVVPDIENPHFGEMVRAVEDQAYERGYRVLVCNTDETPEKQRTYLETMIDERVLGVIISPSDPDGAEIGSLLDLAIPVVAFDREVSDPRADAVLADNVKATRVAVRLLLDEGHAEIAFVGGRVNVETGAERLAGYEIGMRAAGLRSRAIDGDFRLEKAEAAVAALLREDRPPTALVVANNQMTLGALRAVRAAGIGVPAGIAIVAIDDPAWAALVDPPLTTFAQPVRHMAADAMELLLQRVTGVRDAPRRIVHPFELRRRASTGAPRPQEKP